MLNGFAAYCKPRGHGQMGDYVTCRPGRAPEGCFFRFSISVLAIVPAATGLADIAPSQTGIPIDAVLQDSGADITLEELQYPATTQDDNWFPKNNADQSTNVVAGFEAAEFTRDGLDYGTNPWPSGMPPASWLNPLRLLFRNNAAAGNQDAVGYVIFWARPGLGNEAREPGV